MDKRLKCKTTEIKYQSEIELLGGQVIEQKITKKLDYNQKGEYYERRGKKENSNHEKKKIPS